MRRKQLKQNLLFLLVTILTLSQQVQAQQLSNSKNKERNITIFGRVTDSFTNLSVSKAKLTLMRSDSTVIDTCSTYTWNTQAVHPDAYFYMQNKLAEGTYIFKIEHPDYQTTYINRDVVFKGRSTRFDVDDLPIKRKGMQDKEHMLQEVVVKSTKIQMVMKGDTIVFNADAFNLPEGSMLDALIRQLPGATLNSNGEIFINGRKLDYLTLNGKDFFKGDNKALIENLPNYTVKDLKVFEKSTDKSQAMGMDVEKKDYVMDIQLKKQYEKNFITNVDAAVGTNGRYGDKLFSLYFNPRVQMSVFANLNNINEDRKPGEKGDWDPTKLPNGQLAQKTVGMNAAVSNEKNTITNNVSSSFSWRDTHNTNQTASESFLNQGNSFGRSISDDRSKNSVFNLNNALRITKPFFLNFRTDISYNKFNNQGMNRSATFNANPASIGTTEAILDTMFANPLGRRGREIGVNRQFSQSLGTGHSFNGWGSFYIGKELKSGDNLSFFGNGRYENNVNALFSKYQLAYLQGTTANDYRDRYDDTPSHSYNYGVGANYGFKLSNGMTLISSYRYAQEGSYRNNSKYRLDRLEEWQKEDHGIGSLPSSRDSLLRAMDLNNSYSGHYISKDHIISPGLNYSTTKDKNRFYLYIGIPITYKSERLDYRSHDLNTLVNLNNWLLGYYANVGCTFNEYNIWLYSNMDTNTPNVYSMVDRRDDANPLAVSLGNPNLKNTTSYETYLSFSDNHNRRFRLPTININIGARQNDVANGFTYDPATGVYTYKPENVNGNWWTSISINYTCPIDSAKYWTIENNLNYNYNHNVDLTAVKGNTSSVLSKVNNHWLTDNLSLNYQKEGLRCSLTGRLGMRNVNSKRENFVAINTYEYNYGIVGSYRFKFGLETGMDLKMFSRRGYDDPSFNTNDLVANAYISQSFLKGKLAAKLETYDLFQQLKSVSYEVNGQGKTETRFNTIPHYVMLHLIYKFNISGKK